MKARKCAFFATKASFLGNNLMKDGILPDPENVVKILNWPVLGTVCEKRGIWSLEVIITIISETSVTGCSHL